MSTYRAPIKSRGSLSCENCGFSLEYCLCSDVQKLDIDASFALVTHPKELVKQTNSGFLLRHCLSDCEVYEWHRLCPPPALMKKIADESYQPWLLFPPTQQADEEKVMDYAPMTGKRDLFIIVDATWQQAAKIVRKSPWLMDLPRLFLKPKGESQFCLRKNRQPQKVCTAEVGVMLLQEMGKDEAAELLDEYFHHFMQRFIDFKRMRKPESKEGVFYASDDDTRN